MKVLQIKKVFFIFTMLVLTFLCQSVEASCGLSISASDISVTWDMSWSIQSVSITVSKVNPAACTFGLGFSKGGAGSYTRRASNAGRELFYQFYQDSGGTKILKDAPDTATVDDVIMVTLPAGSGPQVVQYFFDIPYSLATTPFLAAAGSYTDNFIINAYEGIDPAHFAMPADASASVNLTVNIDKQINLSFVDLGGTFLPDATTKLISFGTLSTGAISRFNLAMRTNAGFSITATSANNGRLKHITNNSYVPYTMYVNNSLVDTTGAVPMVSGSGQTSLSGLIYPIKIVIGAVGSFAIAGSYSDTITITAIVTD